MKALVTNYLLLIIIGIFAVYSTTYKALIGMGASPWFEVLKLLVVIVCLFIIFIFLIITRKTIYKFINYNIKMAYFILLILLGVVLTKLGTVVGGAHSSINFGVFNFQPIEYFKVVSILYMAKILSKDDYNKLSDKEFIKKKLFFPAVSLVLIMVEPDLGGTIIMTSLILIMLFLNNRRTKLVFKITALLASIGVLGFTVLGVIGYDRVASWINPFEHIDKAGGNLVQSYIALSHGGLLGTGYLNSIQNSGFLFASSTDFIFAIIAEETGIIGVSIVLFLLFSFSYQIYKVGVKSKKKYEYLVCSGIAFLIIIQTAVNVGGVTGVIPMTGVTLPFISRGINSYVTLNIAVFYVFLIYLNTNEEKKDEKRRNKPKHKRRKKSRTK